jgi:antitoxin component YwqK of YwqJK toxin-antitoxin module
MKKIILFSFILCYFIELNAQNDEIGSFPTSPRAEYAVDPSTNQKIKELFFVLQSDATKRHGKYQAFNSSDALVREGQYNKGTKHGLWKEYYFNPPNNLQCEGRYNGDVKSGKWTYYQDSKEKKLKEDVVFLEGGKKANLKRYHDNGVLAGAGDAEIRNGKFFENGSWTLYYRTGQKESEGSYIFVDGGGSSYKTGRWVTYWPNGNMKTDETFSGGRLEGKKTYFNENQDVEKYEYYSGGTLKSTENRFTFQKQKLDDAFIAAEKYKNSIPEIYNGDIQTLKKEYEVFINEKHDDANFQKGNDLIAKLTNINTIHDSLKLELENINKLKDKVTELYKTNYPEIFKAEVEPYFQQIAGYQKLGNIEQRLKGGQTLFAKLNDYIMKGEKIKSANETIKAKMPVVEQVLSPFTLIYSNEIAKFKATVDEYYKINNIDIKLAKADEIANQVNKYNENAETLKKIDTELITKSSIMIGYRDKFKAIFNNINPLLESGIEKYKSVNSIDEKIRQGESILRYIKRLEEDYLKLNEQTESIQAKNNEFNQVFKEDKDNRIVYSKGKIICDLYLDGIDKQAATNSRLNYGKYIISMLDKLIALAGKNNKELLDKLRDAEDAKQIRDAFGIQDN